MKSKAEIKKWLAKEGFRKIRNSHIYKKKTGHNVSFLNPDVFFPSMELAAQRVEEYLKTLEPSRLSKYILQQPETEKPI